MSVAAKVARPWEREAQQPAAASNSETAIDELGRVREQIKGLKAREQELTAAVTALGEGCHDGGKCRAVVAIVESTRLDTTALKAALPEEMIAKYTHTVSQTRVTIKPLI